MPFGSAALTNIMARKKTRAAKAESQIKKASSRLSGEETNGAAENEFPGVHIINRQDAESHFGTSATKASDENIQPATNSLKTEVRLHLDERIWQRAQEAARQAGLGTPEYVERALERFRSDTAK